jgi:hypothetical protein
MCRETPQDDEEEVESSSSCIFTYNHSIQSITRVSYNLSYTSAYVSALSICAGRTLRTMRRRRLRAAAAVLSPTTNQFYQSHVFPTTTFIHVCLLKYLFYLCLQGEPPGR